MNPFKNKISRTARLALVLLSSFILVSCGGGGSSGGGTATAQPSATSGTSTLLSGVVTADSDTTSKIVSSDTNYVVLSSSTAQVAALKNGDIIIINNVARKLESTAVTGSQITLWTSQPQLSEVFSDINLEAHVDLGGQYLDKKSLPVGVVITYLNTSNLPAGVITTQENADSYIFTLTDEPIYDDDGNPDTTTDQVIANGTVTITKPHVDLIYTGFKSANHFHLSGGEVANLQISSPKIGFHKSYKMPLGQFVVPIEAVPGAFITVTLNLVCDASGQASVKADISQSISIDAGLDSTINPFVITPFNNAPAPTFTISNVSADGELDLSLGLDPDFAVQLLEMPVGGIRGNFALKSSTGASVNASTNQACFHTQVNSDISAIGYLNVPKAAFGLNFNWQNWSASTVSIDLGMDEKNAELFRVPTYSLWDSGQFCVVQNAPPIAVAYPTVINADVNSTVYLDATRSSDSNGTIATYMWNQISGVPVTLSNANTSTPHFTAPSSVGALTFRVTVTDNDATTGYTDVVVNVVPSVPTVFPRIGTVSPSPVVGSDAQQAITLAGSGFVQGMVALVEWSSGSKVLSGAEVVVDSAMQARIFVTTKTTTDTWTVQVTNPDGQTSNSVSFTVNTSTSAVTPPTVTLTASPSSIANGATSTLSWSSTNSTSCTSSGGGGTGTAGSFTTPSLTTTTTYTVKCTGVGGTASQSATVTVVATPLTYSISGSAGLSGVTMTLSGASSAGATTDANGNYTFGNLANGSYTIAPALSGYSFTPTSRVITVSGGNITGANFTATIQSGTLYSITGTVTLSGSVLQGVTVTLSGSNSGVFTTGTNGMFAFALLPNGSYTITPALSGYTFTPASSQITINGSNFMGANFTASATNAAPTVQSLAATSVTSTSAQMNGSINPNGLSTSAYFEYGTTTSYGGTTGPGTFSGSSAIPIQSGWTGLIPSTTYHYRAVATNSGGTSRGGDVSFTTAPTQLVVNGIASSYSGVGQLTIPLTGSGFNSLSQISWSCTMPNGSTPCSGSPYVWTPGSARWSNLTITSDTIATVYPTFLSTSDSSGTYYWNVTFSGGGQSVTKYFTAIK